MSGERIFLWEAGAASGTAATRDRAQEHAGGYLGEKVAQALVEEAVTVMSAAGDCGLTLQHQRTGLAWRGRLSGGEPVWEPAGAGAP